MKFIATSFIYLAAFLGNAQEIMSPTNHVELFNGKDFAGFTFFMKDNTDPLQTWSVTNGVIHCTGKPTGYIRSTQSFSNYVAVVEWRFVTITPKADNTGVLLHIQQPDKVWPMCIQVQGRSGHQGDLFLMAGAESKEHQGKDANTALPLRGSSNEKNVGEWNASVTICDGNTVQSLINDKVLNETTGCTISSGTIGIQSEGAEIEIRKIAVEPLLKKSPN